jgi:acetyltransferase-like isoleucine patch superfamily enzyme
MRKVYEKLQKLMGLFLSEPIILKGKTIGYSLVKSQRFACHISTKTRISSPYYLSHVEVGDFSYISKNSNISNTKIGKFCSIGPNFCCGFGMHPTDAISTSPMFYSTRKQNGFTLVKESTFQEMLPISIGNDVFIGANATILDGVKIADGAIIGAGAVVTKDIPPYAIAVGVPAKVVKYRFEEKIIISLIEKQWWDLPDDKLQILERDFYSVEKFTNNNNDEFLF